MVRPVLTHRAVARLALTLLVSSGESWRLMDALRSLMAPTRQTHGCLRCLLSVSTESGQPACVRYTEEWATDDDLRTHVRSDRFPRLLAVMERALEAPTLDFELVHGHRGLDYVEEVRGRE